MKKAISAEEYYDSLGHKFVLISKRRKNFLESVERIISDEKPFVITNFLDFGCGDGIRTNRLVCQLKSKNNFGIDVSGEMIKLAKKSGEEGNIRFERGNFKKLNIIEGQLDLITCLWNVFGHIEGIERLETLSAFRQKLSPGGKIILDINNRHNINAYGFWSVAKNFVKDLLKLTVETFELESNNRHHKVYIHSKKEFDLLIRNAGLKKLGIFFLNYETGLVYPKAISSQFRGQILYILGKNDG